VQRHKGPKALDAVIEHVDAAAFDSSLFTTLAPHIAKTFDSHSTSMFIRNGQSGAWLSHTDNYSEKISKAYATHYHALDLRAHRAAKKQIGAVFLSDEVVSRGELSESEFYRDFARKVGSYHLVGATFRISAQSTCTIGVHRAEGRAPYGEDDRRNLRRLVRHLQRSLAFSAARAQTSLQDAAAREVLHHTNLGAFVLDSNCRILFASEQAERLLARGDAFVVKSGRLTAVSPEATSRFRALVTGAIETNASSPGASSQNGGDGGSGAMLIDRPERLPITVLVSPFRWPRASLPVLGHCALVLLTDPETASLDTALLCELYRFTPAEAVIAVAIAEGWPPEDIAMRLRITPNTLRSHLKSLFQKTDTHRQAELAALLLRAALPFAKR
jgi:DNA-binding CsgD family transcriptional regulator